MVDMPPVTRREGHQRPLCDRWKTSSQSTAIAVHRWKLQCDPRCRSKWAMDRFGAQIISVADRIVSISDVTRSCKPKDKIVTQRRESESANRCTQYRRKHFEGTGLSLSFTAESERLVNQASTIQHQYRSTNSSSIPVPVVRRNHAN